MTTTRSLVFSMFATGCSVSSATSLDDIAATPLDGAVGGQTWTFSTGHTSGFLSEGKPEFFATLYPTAFTTCGFSEPSGSHLIVAIPKTPGDYEMGLSLNMTFVDGSRNLVATNGRIVVDEVTETKVTGGLVAEYDSNNEVNGRFEVALCDD